MNPSFNFQPCELPSNNNVMVNMNGMQSQINFPNLSFHQQQQVPMMNMAQSMNMNMNNINMCMSMNMNSFPMNTNLSFQQQEQQIQPQVNVVPSNMIEQEQPSATVVTNSSSNSSNGSSVRSFIAERKPLAPDFVPGPYDVICARGSAAANSPGNLRFRKTIQDFLPEYSKATTKLEKSLLVTAIVDSVRDKTPNGGFIKKIGDRWCEVGDAACREKIGQCLRDQLHTKYKSSTKAKKPRRKQLKELKKQRKQLAEQKVEKELDLEPLKACSSTDAKELDDVNELSLTNIFYNAMVDEGLNLDNILRC